MLKKWLLRTVIGLLIIIVTLAVTAPARVLESQLISQIPNLNVLSSSGRLWSGQFQQVVYQQQSIKHLAWNLSFFSLLKAAIGAQLTIDDPVFKGSLFVEQGISGTTSISEINAEQSLAELAKRYRPLQIIGPIGQLDWKDVALSWDDQVFNDAEGVIQWQNARLIVNGQQIMLGSINMTLEVENNDLLLQISSDAELDLVGSIRVKRNRRYQLTLSLKEQLPQNIYNAVRFMARPNGKGQLEFSRQGQW